ncbi:Mu transposase C-terminal domain-containing protein [Streptomyces kutzneri]|uniref:Mu transposase C-terminal domain-containing protein n=1 Tax=Streptomyces kutzneri TaxID=3051179 RepID=UPI0028D859FD|nr:Mu transposase C-terminal domain-containing protein [Streptomyces sp. DSM 40907]
MLSTTGIRFRNRDYVAAWTQGLIGERVRVRFMPHHDCQLEVFDAVAGRYPQATRDFTANPPATELPCDDQGNRRTI